MRVILYGRHHVMMGIETLITEDKAIIERELTHQFPLFLVRWFRWQNRSPKALHHRLTVVLLFLLRAQESPDLAGFVLNKQSCITRLFMGKLAF